MSEKDSLKKAFLLEIAKKPVLMQHLKPFLENDGVSLHELSKLIHETLAKEGVIELPPKNCDVLVMQLLKHRNPDGGGLLRTFTSFMIREEVEPRYQQAKAQPTQMPKLPRRVTLHALEERRYIDRPCTELIPFEVTVWHMYQLAKSAVSLFVSESNASIRPRTRIILNQGMCFDHEAQLGDEASALNLKAHPHKHNPDISRVVVPMAPRLSKLDVTGFDISFFQDHDPLTPEPWTPTEFLSESDDGEHDTDRETAYDEYEPGTVFITLWMKSDSRKATLRRYKNGSFSVWWRKDNEVDRPEQESRDAVTDSFRKIFGSLLSSIFSTEEPCKMLLSWQRQHKSSEKPFQLKSDTFFYVRPVLRDRQREKVFIAAYVQFQARSRGWWLQWLSSSQSPSHSSVTITAPP